MKSKIIALTLTIIMAMSVLCVPAMAEDSIPDTSNTGSQETVTEPEQPGTDQTVTDQTTTDENEQQQTCRLEYTKTDEIKYDGTAHQMVQFTPLAQKDAYIQQLECDVTDENGKSILEKPLTYEKTIINDENEKEVKDRTAEILSEISSATNLADAGSYTAKLTYAIGMSGKETTEDAEIITEEIPFTITKRNIIITTDSDYKEYDGKPLTSSNYEIEGDGFPDGQGLSGVEVNGTITDAGVIENTVKDETTVRITAEKGTKDVTKNYTISFKYGTLKITKTVPDAPSNIKIEKSSYDSVTLSWDKANNAGGYTIYKADSENGKYTRVASVDKDVTGYTIGNLTTGKKIYFKVTAEKQKATAASTSAQTADLLEEVVPVEVTPQLAKTAVKGYAKSRISVRVNWNKVEGAQGYILYKYNSSTDSYKRVKTFKSSTTGYTQKKQKAGRKYHYIVRAYRNNDGITANTDSEDVTIATPKKLTMRTPGFWSTNAGKVIKKAKTKRGKPYVWGASGPNRFDCSGFVTWTYKKVGKKVSGVKMSRNSSRSFYKRYSKKYGIGRNLSNAQPGDIIIIGYGGSKHRIFHVGMYYDKGKYIHATTGGRGVTISKIPKSMVVSIIRLPGME